MEDLSKQKEEGTKNELEKKRRFGYCKVTFKLLFFREWQESIRQII